MAKLNLSLKVILVLPIDTPGPLPTHGSLHCFSEYI
jgi:hypothetical protein